MRKKVLLFLTVMTIHRKDSGLKNNSILFRLFVLLCFTSNSIAAADGKVDSLLARVHAFQPQSKFLEKDTAYLVDLWYVCAEFYQLGESDSMRKYADLGLNTVIQLKKTTEDKDKLKILNKYEMIFYKNIGISYFDKDDYISQTKFFHKYLSKARELNNIKETGTALSYIASCHRELEDYDKAFAYAQEAYSILKNTDNKNAIGGALAIYGSYYFDKKVDYDSSYYWKKKVYNLYEETGYLPLLSGATLDIIEIFVYFHEFDSARKYLELSKERVHALGFPEHIMTYNTYQAIIYLKDRRIVEAKQLLTEAMELARQSDVKEDDYNIHKYLSLILAAEGASEDALKTIDSAFSEYSADVNVSKAQALTRAQMDFDFNFERSIASAEQKRLVQLRNFSIAICILLLLIVVVIFQRYRERGRYSQTLAEKNAALESANAALKLTQHELVETEKQREAHQVRVRIARDIHDDIGSGLTKITLLSDITRKKTTDSSVSDALGKVMEYSKGVSTSLSEIVWAIHPGNDNVGSLVNYMKSTANQLLENSDIKYVFDFPNAGANVEVHPEIKRNIYLVMKEALHNILKYSEAKNVFIKFSIDNNRFNLEISDDGKGFEMNTEDHRFGNGLLNMQQRMSQHGNICEIQTSRGKGCRIIAHGNLTI